MSTTAPNHADKPDVIFSHYLTNDDLIRLSSIEFLNHLVVDSELMTHFMDERDICSHIVGNAQISKEEGNVFLTRNVDKTIIKCCLRL